MESGAEQLKDWLDRRWPKSTRKQRDAADHFGWDESFISQLCRGARLPGLINAIRIERETGIPVEAWVSSEVDKPAADVYANARKRQQDSV